MDALTWLLQIFPDSPWVGPVCAVIVLMAVAVLAGKLLLELGKLVRRLWQALARFVTVVETFSDLPDQMQRLDDFATEHTPMLRQLADQVLNDHGNVNLRDELTQAKNDSASALELVTEVRDIAIGLDRGIAGLYQDRESTAGTLDNLDERLEGIEDTFTTPHKKEDPS